jgi:hypothetical protein
LNLKETAMREVCSDSGWPDAWSGWDHDIGSAGRHVAQPPAVWIGAAGQSRASRMTVREVLQHVREGEQGAGAVSDPRHLRRLNERMLHVLEACHRVDTARRQLLNTLKTQKTLDNVSHVLVARVESGSSDFVEQRKLALLLADMRHAVTEALTAWDVASRHFTRLTRLFPAQLDTIAAAFEPVDAVEIDRLAQASVLACVQTRDILQELAQEHARQRTSPTEHTDLAAEDLRARMTRLQDARAEAVGEFSAAREAYLQSVMDFGLAQFRVRRARDARNMAEAGFRIGSRGVLEFAESIINQNRQRNDMLDLESRASVARHALYAMALLLPEQFDLR